MLERMSLAISTVFATTPENETLVRKPLFTNAFYIRAFLGFSEPVSTPTPSPAPHALAGDVAGVGALVDLLRSVDDL